MAYFRNIETHAVREVEDNSPEYRRLQKIRTSDSRFPLYEEISHSQVTPDTKTEHVEAVDASIPSAGAASPQTHVVGEAPYAGRVVSVTFIPEGDVTGQATDYRTFRVLNKGQGGQGTTVVASLAFSSAPVTLVGYDEKVIPLSGTSGNLAVGEGDVLSWDETVTGNGLASPGGKVTIEVARGTSE